MTKAEFNQSIEATNCGGDCWSKAFVLRKAFQLNEVESVLRVHNTGTGLYCDVTVIVAGSTAPQIRRIFG